LPAGEVFLSASLTSRATTDCASYIARQLDLRVLARLHLAISIIILFMNLSSFRAFRSLARACYMTGLCNSTLISLSAYDKHES